MQDAKLAEVFLSERATIINETQSYGDYSVTLLSIVSGEMLSEYPYYNENDSIAVDASPLIGDYNPAAYNIAGMSGNYTDMTEGGILYRLLECDDVELFADHDLYLCVSEGTFYNS